MILSIIGVIHIDDRNQISMLWLWLFSAFINRVMQEVLVRGYLYQMIKNNYNIVAAVIVSTGLFTFAHGGAFEAGILPVLNIITMIFFVTAVLEYTESLIAPIVIHFLWNGVGAIILGGVSLAEDYPHMFNMVISGNSLLRFIISEKTEINYMQTKRIRLPSEEWHLPVEQIVHFNHLKGSGGRNAYLA